MGDIILLRIYAGTSCHTFRDDVAKEAYKKVVEGIQSKGKITYVMVNEGKMTSMIIINTINYIEKVGF